MCNHPTLILELTTPNEGWYRCADCRAKFSKRLEPFRITVGRGERDHSKDKERLDWLSEYVETGCADFGFEMDGGVYLQMSSVGDAEATDFREKNDVREAIDAAMAAEHSKYNKETN